MAEEDTQVQEGSLCIGDKVELQLKNKTSIGELKFIGRIKGKPKEFYGVELRRQEGKNSGGLEGQDYFPCGQQRGVFVARNKILRFKRGDNHQEDDSRFTVGDTVEVEALGTGTIRYMGFPQFCDGMRYGIELDKPNGRYNGTVEGVYYFNARNLFGTFAELKELCKFEDIDGEDIEPSSESILEEQKESGEASKNDEQADDAAEESAATEEKEDDGGDSPVEEEKQVEERQQRVQQPAAFIMTDTSSCFIPALRDDSLLSFMIRQPNGELNDALFDMYCGEGGSLLKSSFEDIRICAPDNQLKILCRLLQRFLGSKTPDFSASLSITPYGCGVNGMYETREAFESGLDGAYKDLLAVMDDDPLKPTIPSSYLKSLPIGQISETIQQNQISLDDLLGAADTGDFILFGGDSGFNRLVGHFSNSSYTHAALIVKGAIVADDITYSSEDSISLLFGCTTACSQMSDGTIDESLPYSVAAAEAVSYLQEKKFRGEFGVYFKLNSEDDEMLADIRQKIIKFAAGSVGCSFAASRDGLPINIRQVLTSLYGNRDAQADFFPSTGLLASAYQEGGLMSESKKAQSFVAGSFAPLDGNRAGYASGPFPHVSTLLYDGVQIQEGAMIDFSTLPA